MVLSRSIRCLERNLAVGIPEEARISQAAPSARARNCVRPLSRCRHRCSSRQERPASGGRRHRRPENCADDESSSSSALRRGAIRNSFENVPAITVGYSMRSGTSSSSVECSIAALPTRPPRLRAFASRPRAMRSWRSCRSRITKCSAEPRDVVLERAHLHRAPGPAAGRQEAMAVGHRGRHDFLHDRRLGQLGAPNRERHDASAVEIENPANRTPEQQIALAILQKRVPVHRLRKAERSQRRRQHVGQHVDRRLAALMLAISEIACPSASPRARVARRRCCSCAQTRPRPESACRPRRTPPPPADR